ncbi:hypothetical protein D1007_51271 [Hordeum vulgare]|nr:hypothetical protein D1007_51271 [Hordeum vulgare]
MVVVPDDDLATVVVPDDDLAMVVVPDDGLAMVIPQHHLKIIHVKDDKVKPEANQWKTNDVQEGTTNGVQEGSGVISDDPEYNPKEDEVVVHNTVKALKESRTKRPGVKKTTIKNRKSSEASAVMPQGRVMAPPPGQTKRILEPDEPDRVTRQKATIAATTDHQENAMTNKHRLRKGKGLERITKSLGTKLMITNVVPSLFAVLVGKFDINTDSETIKYACKDVLQKSSKNRRHNIKKKYFDTVAANKVSTKSPVPDLTDGEWQAMVQMWSIPRHKKEERKGEDLSAIDLFKATHKSKKHGFSEPVKIAIIEMEKMKDAPVPEGEEPKSDAEIVEEVLKAEVKQSTFLRNVGLKSSSNNSGKGTVVVAAHVRDLQQNLERSELQAEVTQEEMAAIKLKP